MKIGISSWTYTWHIGVAGYPLPENRMDVFALLEKAHVLGADVLQIADNLPLEKLQKKDLLRLRQTADAWDIALEVGTKGIRPEKLTAFFEIAEMLGSPIVRTLLHDEHGCPSLDEAEQNIRAVLPVLHQKQLTLAVENHDFFSVEQLRTLMERIGDPRVRICLDPVNNLAQGESSGDVLRTLGEYTVNFHCKDYTIFRKPSNLGFDVVGCAAGDGLLNLPRWMHYFEGQDISFIVELWTPWQETIEATCALENRWAEQSMKVLHRLKAQRAGTVAMNAVNGNT